MWSKDKRIQEELGLASSTSVFAAGLSMTGEIHSKSDIRIEGEVKGIIVTKKKLVVSPSGCIHGDVWAHEVCVMGEVKGNLNVQGLARLTATSKVRGEVISASVEIEAGSDFEGAVKRIEQNQKAEPVLKELKMIKLSNTSLSGGRTLKQVGER
ncbi:MAG: polymer-forming cytoskeletal protein [Lunatimonas sp.]|uniref:bactofilin family protein n=1 Tax=Lunatimonas sp. TaxID=2060141 RepID=UPI00263B8FAF|nr:polymer-forming cytoskeletal protein [Lunatimonas sp.]MCC5939693.1 polymer-forming cytoskeletal protein [Lunatimonas sp.]